MKEYLSGIFRTVLALIVCSASYVAIMLLMTVISDKNNIVGFIGIIVGIALFIGTPILTGRFILKNYGDNRTNLKVVLFTAVIAGIISFFLLLSTYTNDSLGFFVAFMNLPGFLLMGAVGSLFNDCPIVLSCFICAMSPIISMLVAFIGLRLKKKSDDEDEIIYLSKHKNDETAE